jgi:putative aldouronate transport system permease protein
MSFEATDSFGKNHTTCARSANQVCSPGTLFCWSIARFLCFLSPLVLLLPLVWVSASSTMKGASFNGMGLLMEAHGLSDAMATFGMPLSETMVAAVCFLIVNALVAGLLPRHPSFWLVPISLCAVVCMLAAVGMAMWSRKTSGGMLFGMYLFIACQAGIMVLSVLSPLLARLHAGTGERKTHAAFLLMQLPGLAFLLLFCYVPMPGILLAFKKYVVVGSNPFENFFKSQWTGLSNFSFLFASPEALVITRNTVLYNLAFILLGLLFSVGLAIVITELPNRRMAKLYQTIYFLPYFLSWMVVAYVVFALLNYDLGFVNAIRHVCGADPINWYMEPKYWPFIFVFANLWKYTGNGSVIYIAAITGFDTEIYEAAAIDGAGKWKQITQLTIPMLTPMMVMLTILSVGRIFSADVGLFFSLPMGSGRLMNVSNVIDLYVFNALRSGSNIGIPSAAALFQSVVAFVLILVTNAVAKRINAENALL